MPSLVGSEMCIRDRLPPARSPEPAPRLVDTANLLFAHVPGPETISFDVARGRAAHLRRRLDELHKETILGLQPESRPGAPRSAVRSTSPPRPGTSSSQALTAAYWSASPCQPGKSLSSALTADQLSQIKAYLQGQQLLPEDRSREKAPTPARPAAEQSQTDFTIPLLPSYRIAFRNHFEGVTCKILRLNSARYVILYICLLYTSPSPRD